uniref:Uncharacterized protein n=1 Tax=Meloidogyne javanica TaxID=6303 RepID=A0A915MVW2_MELJA
MTVDYLDEFFGQFGINLAIDLYDSDDDLTDLYDEARKRDQLLMTLQEADLKENIIYPAMFAPIENLKHITTFSPLFYLKPKEFVIEPYFAYISDEENKNMREYLDVNVVDLENSVRGNIVPPQKHTVLRNMVSPV